MILVSLCAETINPFLRGTKSDSCEGKCILLSSESCKSNNRGAEFLYINIYIYIYIYISTGPQHLRRHGKYRKYNRIQSNVKRNCNS